jgi:hypothetical protein
MTGRSAPFFPDTPLTGPALLDASNLVAVTASVGQTLDALRALMSLAAEVTEIDRTRALVQEDADMDAPLPSSDGMEEEVIGDQDDDVGVEGGLGLVAGGGGGDRVGSEVEVTARGAELPGGRQPMLASRTRFEVTSRDRLYLQMANLPRRFHQMVAGEFGGLTLLELTASNLATRLLDSSTPASVYIYIYIYVCLYICMYIYRYRYR